MVKMAPPPIPPPSHRAATNRSAMARTNVRAHPATLYLLEARQSSSGLEITPDAPWTRQRTLPPNAIAAIALMIRDQCPKAHAPDRIHIRTALHWDARAAKDPAFHARLAATLAWLDHQSRRRSGIGYLHTPWKADRLQILNRLAKTPYNLDAWPARTAS